MRTRRVPWAMRPVLMRMRQSRSEKWSVKDELSAMHLLKDLNARNGRAVQLSIFLSQGSKERNQFQQLFKMMRMQSAEKRRNSILCTRLTMFIWMHQRLKLRPKMDHPLSSYLMILVIRQMARSIMRKTERLRLERLPLRQRTTSKAMMISYTMMSMMARLQVVDILFQKQLQRAKVAMEVMVAPIIIVLIGVSPVVLQVMMKIVMGIMLLITPISAPLKLDSDWLPRISFEVVLRMNWRVVLSDEMHASHQVRKMREVMSLRGKRWELLGERMEVLQMMNSGRRSGRAMKKRIQRVECIPM